VAGLSAAYELRGDFDVTLYEDGALAGGHANTVEVEEHGRRIGLDTGFIVFNEPNYPRLSQFFKALDVPTLEHKGGFLFFDLDGSLRYSTEDLDIPDEVLRAEYSEEFRTISREARRFYEEAPKHFVRGKADIPLGEYLEREGYSDDFKHGFIVLQGSAVWSAPAEVIWDIPASTVIGYFWSHGHGGLGGRNVAWNTVAGGSRTYVSKVLDELAAAGVKVNLSLPVTRAQLGSNGVAVHFDGGVEHYDYAVVATHADQAARIADDIPDEQRDVLAQIKYNTTNVVLHTDTQILPDEREKWRSWNYGRVGRGQDLKAYVVYYLNEIQQFQAEHDYLLSLDCPLPIDDAKVIASFDYTHPIVDIAVRNLQKDIHAINEVNRIKFCGSYIHCRKMGRDSLGSHEAAYDSGVAAAGSVRRAAAKTAPDHGLK
jgi:predicted NAD/FAD-binding protein